MGKNKKPKVRQEPDPRKQPRANEDAARAYRQKRPAWKFSRHARAGTFCWTSLSDRDLPRVFDALAGYEQMLWKDIEDGRDHCHHMEVADCHREVGEYLTQHGWDIDTLFQLSVGNKGRVFGVRSEHEFEIIFWDVDHKVYETKKRNT